MFPLSNLADPNTILWCPTRPRRQSASKRYHPSRLGYIRSSSARATAEGLTPRSTFLFWFQGFLYFSCVPSIFLVPPVFNVSMFCFMPFHALSTFWREGACHNRVASGKRTPLVRTMSWSSKQTARSRLPLAVENKHTTPCLDSRYPTQHTR